MEEVNRELSVVIPLLNEEPNLEELYRRLTDVLQRLGRSYEILFVDDGSVDGSFEVLERLHHQDSHVCVIQFRRNYGKAAALAQGFKDAKGKIIITMDADLQDDPEEIPNLVAKIEEGYDLVSGWKYKRHDPISKTLPSWIFNRVTALLTGIRIHDFNCGLKAYRLEVTRNIKVYGELHRYLPVLAHWQGYRVGEIKVKHHPRLHGRTKYGARRFLSGFLDLFTVILLTRYISRPLHLFGAFGALVAIIGFGINCYLAYLRFRFGSIMGHYPLLGLGVLMMILGVQLFSIGLLGELISSTQLRDLEYSIKKRLS
ncbi:MAG TPA: glycosyltransferase [Candidatus Latescibacteria bacterium]|nr:glycosyltransferase [Candidatus Latescibacterota bacterium]